MISAQAWADTLAATNSFEHSTPFDLNGVCVGENLYSSTGDESSAIDATRAWYCEVDDYKENPNVWTSNPAIGHFTQVNAHFYSLPKKNWESCHCHSRWCGKTPRGLALALPEAAMDGPGLSPNTNRAVTLTSTARWVPEQMLTWLIVSPSVKKFSFSFL